MCCCRSGFFLDFVCVCVCVVAVVVYLIFGVLAMLAVDFSLIFCVVLFLWWWIICVAMDVFCVAMVVMDYLIFCGFLVVEVVVMGFLAVVVVGFL